MAKINSHYIQKALLKEIFPERDKIFELNGLNLASKLFEEVSSSYGLFPKGVDNQSIEREMNSRFESKAIEILRKISKANNKYTISYENAFLLRKYFLITFHRLLMKDASEYKDLAASYVIMETFADYYRRFQLNNDPLSIFFFEDSTIKIIEHDDILFVNEDCFFMPMPISVFSDFEWLLSVVRTYPGFVVPISKNRSIVFLNQTLSYRMFIQAMFNSMLKKDKKLPINFCLSNSSIVPFFMPDAKVILDDGKIQPAIKISSFEDWSEDKSHEFKKEIMSRDPKKTKYIWKIHKIPSIDFELTILNALAQHFHVFPIIANKMLIGDIDNLKKLFKKWLDVNEFVEANQPQNTIYWAGSIDLWYQHAIWEMMDDKFQNIIEQLIDIL